MSIRWMYATERRSIALRGFAFMLILAVTPFPTENFGAQRGCVVRARTRLSLTGSRRFPHHWAERVSEQLEKEIHHEVTTR